jgi:hypothetical protein
MLISSMFCSGLEIIEILLSSKPSLQDATVSRNGFGDQDPLVKEKTYYVQLPYGSLDGNGNK